MDLSITRPDAPWLNSRAFPAPVSTLEFESSRGMGSDHVRFLASGIMTWSDNGLPQVTPR